ncbi:MAG: hypothetical protein ACLTYW_07775 [Collinsella sp.]
MSCFPSLPMFRLSPRDRYHGGGALRAIDEVRGMGEGIHRVSGLATTRFARADGRHSHRALWLPDQWRQATNMLLNTLDGEEGRAVSRRSNLGISS